MKRECPVELALGEAYRLFALGQDHLFFPYACSHKVSRRRSGAREREPPEITSGRVEMIGKQDRGYRPASDRRAVDSRAVDSRAVDSRQQLAQELVACLGRDGALHVCKVNGWQGILEMIVTEDTAAPNPPRH